MKNLKIDVYKTGETDKPETTITIPLNILHIALNLIPKKTKAVLKEEGIDLSLCSELIDVKDIRAGELIRVENPKGTFVISVE